MGNTANIAAHAPIMRSLLIIALLGSAAAGRATPQKSLEVGKEPAAKKAIAPSDKEVSALEAHLEKVVTGLTGIIAANKAKQVEAPGQEPPKFVSIVEPFVQSVSAVLKKVKTDATLTQAQKVKLMQDAQASVTGLMKDMAKRQQELSMESESEEESLLIGVLMARQGRSEKEQMEVLNTDEFKNLAVVKDVLAHRDSKVGLAEQVAAYLDKKAGKKVAEKSNFLGKNMTKAQAVASILKTLETQEASMEKHLKQSEVSHKQHLARIEEAKKADAKKAANMTGTDEFKKKVHKRAQARFNRMMKKSERDYQKQHALAAKDVKSMKEAVESIKKGDMTALSKARKALQDSLQAMKATSGDFLHFLQISVYTSAKDGACPFCKAQCLEKCHSGGQSFMQCMTSCDGVGN